MNLYDQQCGKIPKTTSEARLKTLLINAIGLFAEAHSDRYNSTDEFMCIMYDELGTDEAEMKALDIDLSSI